MKFRVTMKDPDVLHDAIDEAVREEVKKINGLNLQEQSQVAETRVEAIKNLCSRWFEYDEYLVVEVDTDATTCTVVPNDE